MITTFGITKSYGSLKVLKGIDINIREKEVVSIVGASGAGKTTLLQIIGTLDKPDQGEVFFNSVNVSTLYGKELAAFRNKISGLYSSFISYCLNLPPWRMSVFRPISRERVGLTLSVGQKSFWDFSI